MHRETSQPIQVTKKRSFLAKRNEVERSGTKWSEAERSGAKRIGVTVISSYVPIGVESQKRSENVHFRSHCYIRCEKTSFSGERNLEDWQDVLYNSL